MIARRDERGHFPHHPSKPLMFVPRKRTPRPALVSSYVAGNRIKSSHSSLREGGIKRPPYLKEDDVTLCCVLWEHDSRLSWNSLAEGPVVM